MNKHPLVTRWETDPGNAQQLRELLSHPVFQEALVVLAENGLPVEGAVPEGVDFTVWGALQNARREGYFKFRNDLLALTVVAGPTNNATPLRSWQHRVAVPEETTTTAT